MNKPKYKPGIKDYIDGVFDGEKILRNKIISLLARREDLARIFNWHNDLRSALFETDVEIGLLENSKTVKTNTNLITAIPEILEALEEITSFLGTAYTFQSAQPLLFEKYIKCCDAIKKAKEEK